MKKHFWYCWFRAAANDEEREAWQLGHIDSYRYLESDCTVETVNGFKEVRKAMDAVGLCQSLQNDIFRTLVAILTLGNLAFTGGRRPGEQLENVTVFLRKTHSEDVNNEHQLNAVEIVYQLLGLHTEEAQTAFELALTSKRIRDTRSNLSPAQAKQNVDSLARCLYQALFDYLVKHINQALQSKAALPQVTLATPENDVQAAAQCVVVEARTPAIGEVLQSDARNGTQRTSSVTLYDSLGSHREESRYVGVLDIFGFEDLVPFSPNGFEQLCINYANERLHSFFIHQLIERDIELYRTEGVSPPDNLMEHRVDTTCSAISTTASLGPPGIFQLLDEASLVPVVGTKDAYFCQKVNTVLGQPERGSTPHIPGGVIIRRKSFQYAKEFIVRHFAGDVVYTAEGFNTQNLDFLPVDLKSCLMTYCTGSVANALFGKTEDNVEILKRKTETSQNLTENEVSKNFPAGGSHFCSNVKQSTLPVATTRKRSEHSAPRTLASLFCRQVDGFLATLEQTSSWFIRCIKPNDEQAPGVFHRPRVRQQLETGGMVAALRWMAEGYPCRVSFRELWATYGDVLPESMRDAVTPRDFASLILLLLGKRSDQFQLGHSRAFFRFGLLHDVESLRDVTDDLERQRMAQRLYVFWLRKKAQRCFAAVRCIALLNLRLRKRRYLRIALEAKERYFRVWLPRYRAVIFVQNYWRKQRHLRALKHRAEHIIQQFCLKWLSQRRYHRLRAVASQIQTITHTRLIHNQYVTVAQSVEVLQAAAHCNLRRASYKKLFVQQRAAALRLQRWWRTLREEKAKVDAYQTAVSSQHSPSIQPVKRRRTTVQHDSESLTNEMRKVPRRRSFLDFLLNPRFLKAVSNVKDTHASSGPLTISSQSPRSISPVKPMYIDVHGNTAPSPLVEPSRSARARVSLPCVYPVPHFSLPTLLPAGGDPPAESPCNRTFTETFHTPRELSPVGPVRLSCHKREKHKRNTICSHILKRWKGEQVVACCPPGSRRWSSSSVAWENNDHSLDLRQVSTNSSGEPLDSLDCLVAEKPLCGDGIVSQLKTDRSVADHDSSTCCTFGGHSAPHSHSISPTLPPSLSPPEMQRPFFETDTGVVLERQPIHYTPVEPAPSMYREQRSPISFRRRQSSSSTRITDRAEIAALVNMPEFRNAVLHVLQEELLPLRRFDLRTRGHSLNVRNITSPDYGQGKNRKVRHTAPHFSESACYFSPSVKAYQHTNVLQPFEPRVSVANTNGMKASAWCNACDDYASSVAHREQMTVAGASAPDEKALKKNAADAPLSYTNPVETSDDCPRISATSWRDPPAAFSPHLEEFVNSELETSNTDKTCTRHSAVEPCCPRRVSWLLMEDSADAQTSHGSEDGSVCEDDRIPVPIAEEDPSFHSQIDVPFFETQRTTRLSATRNRSPDVESPLLQHGLFSGAKNSAAHDTPAATEHKMIPPLRRSILITDEILHATKSADPWCSGRVQPPTPTQNSSSLAREPFAHLTSSSYCNTRAVDNRIFSLPSRIPRRRRAQYLSHPYIAPTSFGSSSCCRNLEHTMRHDYDVAQLIRESTHYSGRQEPQYSSQFNNSHSLQETSVLPPDHKRFMRDCRDSCHVYSDGINPLQPAEIVSARPPLTTTLTPAVQHFTQTRSSLRSAIPSTRRPVSAK